MNKLIIFFLLLLNINVFGQFASITFVTDQKSKVAIYKPIDGQYTNTVIDKEFELTPGENSVYQIDVDDFVFISCSFGDMQGCRIFLTPGENLIVKKSGSELLFEGVGANETSFLNNDYLLYLRPIAILLVEMKNPNVDYLMFKPTMDSCFAQFNHDIGQMDDAKLTPLFKKIVKKSLLGELQFYSLLGYLNASMKAKELPYSDSLKISELMDDVCNNVDIHDKDLLKTFAGAGNKLLPEYLHHKYSKLKDEEKESLFKNKKIEKDAYGSLYEYMIIAPDSIELRELGWLIYFEYKSYKNDIDKVKLYAYYKDKYPNSEYLQAIDKLKSELQKKEEMSKTQHNDSIIFIDEKIDLLKGLSTYAPLKGKYIFVDVWATWCAPCIKEFQFKDSLYELLKNYKDMTIVYISIDDRISNKYWKIKASDYGLKGYNLLASEVLHNDIRTKVSEEKNNFSIPQYILLDKDGNIINKNLSKPSELDRLKKELDEIVK